MAAEFVLTFAMKEILKKLGSTAIDGISRAWGLKKELQKLRESTRIIQSVLQDAEEKQAMTERVKLWLPKLQEVVYSAEDVLDEFSYETLRREVEIQDQLKRKVRDFVSRNNPILFRLKMAAKLKKINKSLADIENQARGEQAIRGVVVASHGAAVDSQPGRAITDSRLDKSETPIGRKSEVEAIINMVRVSSSTEESLVRSLVAANKITHPKTMVRVSSDDPPFLTVVSIVGFGGIGKTTLAKLVYQEVKEKKLFDKTIWVCVSETFDDQRILGAMLETLEENTSDLRNIDAILDRLQKGLDNKSFLLVLDDVWNENSKKWDSLKSRLQKICGRGGNFVIVTTRSRRVAEVMDTSPQHLVNLEQLPHDACWSIIKNKWLEKWRESMPQELETIGTEIAKKCGGVPLAAQVLGGTLSSNKDKEVWLSIKDSHAWEAIDEEDNRILSVLKLSFDSLHGPVKQCFAYCSLFPKNFVFKKEQLIQLWMAEEFLNATTTTNRGARSMEDVGEEYFNSLLSNSFFQDAEGDDWGDINCKMHDLLHDLAMSVFNTQLLEADCIFKTFDGRHLNFACDRPSIFQQDLTVDLARNVRSLFSKVDVSSMLPNFKCLRSLDVSNANLKELSFAIGKLIHLRYLDISMNESIQVLPDSITKLYNLQTLRLLNCNSLEELPSNIRNLVSLRHIYFNSRNLMPCNVGCLTSLQTLRFFVVGLEEGYKINELEVLNDLRGKLEFCNLEHVRDGEEAKTAKLEQKNKLSKLVLTWEELEENETKFSSFFRERNHEDVLESLQAPSGILSLTIQYYMGKQFPQWMSQLNKLVNLELKHCNKCETMPTLGNLGNLKVLVVEEMDNMKFMGSEFYGTIRNNRVTLFPALEEFSIKKMKSLVKWSTPVGAQAVFPLLRKLYIKDCPCLISIPLTQLTSSVIGMQIERSLLDADLVDIWCLQGVKSLKSVEIDGCPKLTPLPISLTSLQSLQINDRLIGGYALPPLKAMKIVGRVKMFQEFPSSLESLKIYGFDNFAFHGLSSLKHLEMAGCSRLQSIPALSSLTSLHTLIIHMCLELSDLLSDSFSALTCLEELSILGCPKLSSLPAGIKFCMSLKVLSVCFCEGLISIADDNISTLTRLKEIELGGFSEELEEFPGLNSIHQPSNPSLEEVTIYGWNKLKSVPHQLQHLTAMKKLNLENFNGVETLADWLGELSSLQSLTIGRFWNLKNLPPAMQRLSKLTELYVWECPLLKERCTKDIGPDWPNISHIPYIEINYQVVQNLRFPTYPQISL